MSLIKRKQKPGGMSDQRDSNIRYYFWLEEAVKKACMESRQSGKSVATELSTMISPMVAELQKIVTTAGVKVVADQKPK